MFKKYLKGLKRRKVCNKDILNSQNYLGLLYRNFEDSEDELRHELQESPEKVATSPAERTMESSILSVNKGQAVEENMSLPHKVLGGSDDDDLENNHGSLGVDTHNEKGKQEASAS